MIQPPIANELVTGYLTECAIPGRSQLFALAAEESTPEQREGLISLLVRTSGAHSLNPRRLIAEVLAKAAPAVEALAYPCFFNRLAGTINGHGKYANLFVQVLENLTGQRGLSRLTMLPWKDLFPPNGQGMLSRHPHWCSACLLEQRRSREDVYFPLLWSMEAYRYCSIHGQALDDQCPHCGKRQPFLSRYPDQAICHHCLRSLIHFPASSAESRTLAVSEFETWVGKALGSMVAQHGTVGFTPSIGEFHRAVKAIVEAATGGNRAAFCRSIGLNEYALKNWMTKGERPSMTQLLTLGYAVLLPPVDLIAGGTSPDTIQYPAIRIPRKLKIRKCCANTDSHHRATVRRWLQEELQAEPARPVSAIATRCGLTAPYLRYWFPDTCRQLTARYKASLREKSAERLDAQIRRVQDIVNTFRSGNRYPSRRKVDTILRKEGASLGKRALFSAYQAALVA